ncbi:MAG TPA: hypothetical protein VFO77_02370 [Actinoplanes sp.]|nr:hypothetical protein [Actinoplanes sp.]
MTELLHPRARIIDLGMGRTYAGDELTDLVDAAAEQFAADTARRWIAGAPAGVVLALTPTDALAVARYLGAFTAGRAIALLDPRTPGTALGDLIERLAPPLVTGVGADRPPAGYRAAELPGLGRHWVRTAPGGIAPPPDTAVVLSTGTRVGDPTLVAMSAAALHDNAEAMAGRLGVHAGTLAAYTQPLFTDHGLSTLNAHLLRGATVLLDPAATLPHRSASGVAALTSAGPRTAGR